MWTRNNDVSNWNMLKHFIHSSFSKLTTSFLCSLYYRYSSKSSSFFCILSFLVKAISNDQTFYSATHYLAAVWLDFRHDFNIDDVLFKKDLLWISENIHTKLLQEVHDQSSIFYLDNKWIINLVQRFYYWSNH